MLTEKTQGGKNSLTAALPTQINQEHQACMQAAGAALEHAMRCGDLLQEAKADCRHGEWQSWLQEHFEASPQTARAYMRLADNRELIEAKAQSSAVMSIDGALKMLAAPAYDGEKRLQNFKAIDWEDDDSITSFFNITPIDLDQATILLNSGIQPLIGRVEAGEICLAVAMRYFGCNVREILETREIFRRREVPA